MIFTRYLADDPPTWANDPIEAESQTITVSTLIRAPGGHIRVLRLVCADRHTWPYTYDVAPDEHMCRVCGCTEALRCEGGCAWVTAAQDLCSRCHTK